MSGHLWRTEWTLVISYRSRYRILEGVSMLIRSLFFFFKLRHKLSIKKHTIIYIYIYIYVYIYIYI